MPFFQETRTQAQKPPFFGWRLYLCTLAVELSLGVTLRWVLVWLVIQTCGVVLGKLASMLDSNMYLFWAFFNCATFLFLWQPPLWSVATWLGFITDDLWSPDWRRSRTPSVSTSEQDDISARIRAIVPEYNSSLSLPTHWRILNHPTEVTHCIGNTLYFSRTDLGTPGNEPALLQALIQLTNMDSVLGLALRRLVLPPFLGRSLHWRWATEHARGPYVDLHRLGGLLRAAICGGVGIVVFQRQWEQYWHARVLATDATAKALGYGDLLRTAIDANVPVESHIPFGARLQIPQALRATHLHALCAAPQTIQPATPHDWHKLRYGILRFIWMVAIAASIRFAGLLPARVEHGEFLVRYGTGVLQTPPDGEEVAFVWQPFSISNELEIRRDVVSITDQPVVLNAMYYYNSPTSIYIQPRAGAIPSLQTDIGGSYQIQSRSTDIVLQGRQTLILTFSPRIRYPTFLKGRPSPTQ